MTDNQAVTDISLVEKTWREIVLKCADGSSIVMTFSTAGAGELVHQLLLDGLRHRDIMQQHKTREIR